MNLVDLVTSQLTGDVLSKLGGLAGTNETQTRAATSAAVPALLSAFSKLASTNSGASQMASSLGGLDLKTLGNLAGLLGGGQASSLGTMGGSLLSSLLGNNLGSLVGTIASFAGMQPGIMKTLLTYLAPIVMGTIANQFKGTKPDASGLMKLFSEQQDNIKAAMPRGLSLADFDTTSASPRRGEETRGVHRHEEPASGFPSWLPLLLLPLLGLAGWWWMNSKAEKEPQSGVKTTTGVVAQNDAVKIEKTETTVTQGNKVVADVVEETIEFAPGVAEALKEVTGLFGGLTTVLNGVTNEDSARAAIPELEAFKPSLEALQKSSVALPDAGRSMIAKMVLENMGGLQKVIATIMAIPGVKEILGPTVTPMVEAIEKLGT